MKRQNLHVGELALLLTIGPKLHQGGLTFCSISGTEITDRLSTQLQNLIGITVIVKGALVLAIVRKNEGTDHIATKTPIKHGEGDND